MSWYKMAAKPKPVPLKGVLRNNGGYVYLDVDSRLFAPFIKMIDDEAVVHPKEVTPSSKDVGAHITVMKKDETKSLAPSDDLEFLTLEEVGEEFEFFIEGLQSVKPDGWEGIKKVYFLNVSSPELEKLRKKYDLTPKIKDHDFHITVGIEKTAQTQTTSNGLIDKVTVTMSSGDRLVLLINGMRYEYAGIPGSYWNGEISRWKTWKNKRAAGEKLSVLIRNIDRYRVK